MIYDEIESFTSHAWTMVTRAASNITCIENLLWEIKVKYDDDPYNGKVKETNICIATTREQLQKALSDLDNISEEMKRYNH